MSHPSIHVRVPDDLLLAVNAFRRDEPDLPTMPEAIRRLLGRAIAARPTTPNPAQCAGDSALASLVR
jgi:hypothetical protein